MARRASDIKDLLHRIENLSEVERCELLEQIALRYRRDELGWAHLDDVRGSLPTRSEREVRRDVDRAVREARRELASGRRS